MKAALNAVWWEIIWKNRVVFPILALFLILGATTCWVTGSADPDAWWVDSAKRITVMSFLASMFIGFTPFTLMESQGGWRMNSMITRWYVLPVRTIFLVILPLLAASVFLVVLVSTWMPVLNRLAPGLDAPYFIAVLIVGSVATQALAWAVPRKPAQYWTGVALLFPFIFILALGPMDHHGAEPFRRGMVVPFAVVSLLFTLFAWYAASRNRCGDWPGELPVDRIWQIWRGGARSKGRQRDFHSRGTALFWSDILPALRLLAFSWLALALVLYVYVSITFRDRYSDLAFSWRLFAFMALNPLPILGVMWLAGWGLYLGSEPATGFRTRLNKYRATLPLSCGALAAQRILTLAIGWSLVWLPLVVLSLWYDPGLFGMDSATSMTLMRTFLARLMAVGAYVMVGALPLLLWGRWEGFPNFLLAGLCSWALIWLLFSALKTDGDPGWRWILVGIFLALKLGATTWALVLGWRAGHTTWRFPAGLVLGWLAVTAFLLFGLPTWRADGAWRAVTLVLIVPLARLAWCPLALAANRHR